MKRYPQLLVLILLLAVTNLFSQSKETNIWYFGKYAGIDFNGGAATPLTNGQLTTTEGCATIADTTGALRFYTDGITVWDKTHQIMPNGVDLMGNSSSTQSGIIIPQPGDDNIYYIFTVDAWENNLENGFRYSKVDLTLNGGLGDIVASQKNIKLVDQVCEKVTAVKHGNNNSIWVITHRFNSFDFHAYLISPTNGLSTTPVISSVGDFIGNNINNSRGYIKAAANGEKIAMAVNGYYIYEPTNYVEIFDFDDETGVLSNPVHIDGFSANDSAYGVEFSPNSKYLYVSERTSYGNLYQFDVESNSPSVIYASKHVLSEGTNNGFGAIQLAPDGNIYVARRNSYNIDRILEPDKKGAACEYDPLSFYLSGRRSWEGLPPFIQTYLLPDFIVDGGCLNDTTYFQMNLFAVDSVSWDFGDPNSGVLNYSTDLEPYHIYTEPGIYNVTLTAHLNGLTGVKTHDTKVNVVEADLGPDTIVCEGQLVTLSSDVEFASYTWSNNSSEEFLTVSQPGEYWVNIDYNGCVDEDTIIVEHNPLPLVDFADTTLCEGQTIFLDATYPDATYTWQDGSTSPFQVVDNSGYYEVDIEALGCSATSSLFVNMNPIPTFSLGEDTTLCVGESISFNVAQPNATYVWQDGTTEPNFQVSEPSAISVALTVENCTWVDNVMINYNPLPTVDFGDDITLCENQSLLLNASNPNANYLWHDGSTDSTFHINEAGNYSVEIEMNNCTTTEAIQVNFNPLPIIELGDNMTLCENETVTLEATLAGATYSWQDNSDENTFEVVEAGTYTVQLTLNDCNYTDEITVDYNPLPVADFGDDVTLCDGETITLHATNPNANYTWNNGTSNNTLTVQEAGIYAVEIEMNNCTITEEIQVDYNPLPIIELGDNVTLCETETLVLDGSLNGATYSWQDNSNENTFEVVEAGTYTVQLTLNDCNYTDEITVDYNPLPVADFGDDVTLCDGETITLDATNLNANYTWNNGTSNNTLTVQEAGIYAVEIEVNNCILTEEIQVNYNPIPVVNLGEDLTLCEGENSLIDGTQPNATYLWQDGSTAPTFLANAPGMYSLAVTIDGCQGADEMEISYNPLPVVSLGTTQTLCEGETTTLNAAQGTATYLWNNGSTEPTLFVDQPGNYSVELTIDGCSDVQDFDVFYTPLPVVNLGEDLVICEEETFTLDASHPGGSYLWSNGSTEPQVEVSAAGTFTVEVTVDNCSASDAISVSTITVPSLNLGNDVALCEGETYNLDAYYSDDASYVWSDGNTDSDFTITEEGLYTVAVSNQCGTVEDDIYAFYNAPPPTISIGTDTTICSNSPFIITATNNNTLTYLWQDGSTDAYMSTMEEGVYQVIWENECGASTSYINVEFEDCSCDIFVPNAFSPDANGMNDGFRAYPECELLDYNLKIFNRWGARVFESNDLDDMWNGQFKGRDVQVGVYVYLIEFEHEYGKGILKGDVTVVK